MFDFINVTAGRIPSLSEEAKRDWFYFPYRQETDDMVNSLPVGWEMVGTDDFYPIKKIVYPHESSIDRHFLPDQSIIDRAIEISQNPRKRPFSRLTVTVEGIILDGIRDLRAMKLMGWDTCHVHIVKRKEDNNA